MKKIVVGLAVAIMSVLGVAMLPAQEASATDCYNHFLGLTAWYDGLTDSNCEIIQPNSDEELKSYVWTIALNVVSMIMGIVGYLAIGLVMWGGIQYMIAHGDPVKLAKGKKTITNAVVGLALVMTASIISGTVAGIVSGVSGSTNGKEFFQGIFNKVFLWSGIIAVIMIIIGGVQYTTSQGDSAKLQKAKNTIMYGIIGLVVVLLSFAIVSFVLNGLIGG